MNKADFLQRRVQHIDIKRHNVTALVESMRHMAYSARDLARAAEIYDMMLGDSECGVMLCLAGSLISAGLKQIFVDLIRHNMADCIISTGANIVDQDFFEALGFSHYIGEEGLRAGMDDATLRELHIDRIYDTLIDEDELRACDDTIRAIADALEPRPYSSREFIREMGVYLEREGKASESIVLEAYRKDVPVFCPAFSDCSAGFGLVMHQHARGEAPRVSIDSVKDFHELTQLKIKNPATGLLMIGGGVPKNFTQDVVVAAETLGYDAPMHKYALQVTVADVRSLARVSSRWSW
ncbi:MAG: deoxyhypusine synthase family protein, partial [Terriglobia bacterium]